MRIPPIPLRRSPGESAYKLAAAKKKSQLHTTQRSPKITTQPKTSKTLDSTGGKLIVLPF